MNRDQVYKLFTKYHWKQGKEWYLWLIVIGDKKYMAHVGGISEQDLNVCFSVFGSDLTADGVIIDTKKLEEKLEYYNKERIKNINASLPITYSYPLIDNDAVRPYPHWKQILD